MATPSPDPVGAAALRRLLDETQASYARLLVSFEQFLAIDPEADPDLAKARDHQATQLMEEADARLQALRRAMEPWSGRRKNIPVDLAAHVDRFLDLLEKSLVGVQAQITHRTGDLLKRKQALQAAMDQLGQQRRGLKGYQQKPSESKLLKKNA